MRRAINRLWDWLFHPSVRREKTLNGHAVMYRYPSPGSNIPYSQPTDYRQPFSTSQYNVRFAHQIPKQFPDGGAALKVQTKAIDPLRKLVLLGYLQESEKANEAAVEQAKRRYQVDYKKPVEDIVARNDMNIFVADSNDRESIRESIQLSFEAQRVDIQENVKHQRDENSKVDIIEFQSLDLFSAPHFQQRRIEGLYALDQIARQRCENQGLDMRKGEAKFWKALDNSNDAENIEKVQQKIGDSNPKDYNLRENKMEFIFDKDGNVIDLKLKE